MTPAHLSKYRFWRCPAAQMTCCNHCKAIPFNISALPFIAICSVQHTCNTGRVLCSSNVQGLAFSACWAAFCPAEPSAAIVRESPLQSDDGFVQTSKQVNGPFRITATKGSNRLAGVWRCSPLDSAFGITQPPNVKRFASINRYMLAKGFEPFSTQAPLQQRRSLYDE